MGVGRHEFEMRRGDVLFLRPGQDHEMCEASADLELFVVALTPEAAARCLRTPLPVESKPIRLPESELDPLRDRLLALGALPNNEAHERLIGDLFARSATEFGSGHPIARKAFATISSRPETVADRLADRLRVQPTELAKYFHRELGLRLVEYRTRVRLMRFIASVDGGTALTPAALEASFGSYAQCHRVFHRYLGCSPKAYFSGQRLELDTLFEPVRSPASRTSDERAVRLR